MKYVLPTAIVLAFYLGLVIPAVELYNRANPSSPSPRTQVLDQLK